MSTLRIGTSGWSYDDWRGIFYPEDIEKRDMLPYYVQKYSTVEINATFYRIPFKNMVKGWNNKACDDFIYAVKGHRRVTHYNKLKEIEDTLEQFFGRVRGLGDHLGPVLWQLPPSLKKDFNLLSGFLELLPEDIRQAIEFRDDSWLEEDIFDLLSEHNAACVWVSSNKMPADFTQTADFVYARFHGLSGGFDYDYSREELEPWAKQIEAALQEDRDCYIYFNNDKDGMALKSISKLKKLMDMNNEE